MELRAIARSKHIVHSYQPVIRISIATGVLVQGSFFFLHTGASLIKVTARLDVHHVFSPAAEVFLFKETEEMKQEHQLNTELINDLKLYLEEQEHGEVRKVLNAAKVQLRSVVAVDIKCHPKLLYIYGQFNKMKDMLDQHLLRKEQLLFPFVFELVNGDEPGQIANAKVVDSFLSVFRQENETLSAIMGSIDTASGNYKTEVTFPPGLRQSFIELKDLSEKIARMIGKENSLFHAIHQNYKLSLANRKRT